MKTFRRTTVGRGDDCLRNCLSFLSDDLHTNSSAYPSMTIACSVPPVLLTTRVDRPVPCTAWLLRQATAGVVVGDVRYHRGPSTAGIRVRDELGEQGSGHVQLGDPPRHGGSSPAVLGGRVGRRRVLPARISDNELPGGRTDEKAIPNTVVPCWSV
jgi:hypothetical protein